MPNKTKKSRKQIKVELKESMKKDIDVMADTEPDPRISTPKEEELNRYGKKLLAKKEEKRLREEAKKEKIYIGKRKHIEKRAIAEAALQRED